jgi:hypothetical protein
MTCGPPHPQQQPLIDVPPSSKVKPTTAFFGKRCWISKDDLEKFTGKPLGQPLRSSIAVFNENQR